MVDQTPKWGFTEQRGWGPTGSEEEALASLHAKTVELIEDEDPYVRARELCGLSMEANFPDSVGEVFLVHLGVWNFLTDAVDGPRSSVAEQRWGLGRMPEAAEAWLAVHDHPDEWASFTRSWSLKSLLREYELAVRQGPNERG